MLTKGQKTKQRLLEEAIQLFYELGFSGVTFDLIAKRCEISQPAVYKYFSDRYELLVECSYFAAGQGREFIAKNMDPLSRPVDQLEDYVTANMNWLGEHPEHTSCLVNLFALGSVSELVDSARATIQEGGVQTLSIILKNGCHSGDWVIPEKEILFMARGIHSLLAGEIIKILGLPREERHLKQRSRQVTTLLRRLLKD